MAKVKKIVKKVATKKAGKKSAVKKPLAESETEAEESKKTIAKKVSKVGKPKRRRKSEAEGDDLPPEDVDEAEAKKHAREQDEEENWS